MPNQVDTPPTGAPITLGKTKTRITDWDERHEAVVVRLQFSSWFFWRAAFVTWRYVLPWWRTQPPPASGGELTVRILDVGPINGDSILITSPSGKTVLIDAGDTTKGKAVVDALKRNNIQQLDYFIATHPHPDHIGGAAEVFKAVKVLNVIDNGQPPSVPQLAAPPSSQQAAGKKPSTAPAKYCEDDIR